MLIRNVCSPLREPWGDAFDLQSSHHDQIDQLSWK